MSIDLRIRTDAPRGSLCLEPLTERGRLWISYFMQRESGRWLDRDGRTCFWTLVEALPQDMLRDSDLTVVLGQGPGTGRWGDRSADAWLGRDARTAARLMRH